MQTHDRPTDIQQAATGRSFIPLFIGFVIFITGLFCVLYSILACVLTPQASSLPESIFIGIAAMYLGRKVLRRCRRQPASLVI